MDEFLLQFVTVARTLSLTPEEKNASLTALRQFMVQPLTRTLHLTEEEKQEGKEALLAFIRSHPVEFPQKISVGEMLLSFLSRFPAAAVASVLLVVVSAGATTYASESSLPGDLLYPLKVTVLEPFRERFIEWREEKANLALRRVERRLEEARKLASGTRPMKREQRDAIERQISWSITDIEQERGNEMAALPSDHPEERNVYKKLEDTITAYEQILALPPQNEKNREHTREMAQFLGKQKKNLVAHRGATQAIPSEAGSAALSLERREPVKSMKEKEDRMAATATGSALPSVLPTEGLPSTSPLSATGSIPPHAPSLLQEEKELPPKKELPRITPGNNHKPATPVLCIPVLRSL